MPSERKFHRTVYQIEVLSEEPMPDISLNDLAYEIIDGHCSGVFSEVSSDVVNATQIVALLKNQGSDPEFFMLDKNGEDVEY
jgi:hypothetical protein